MVSYNNDKQSEYITIYAETDDTEFKFHYLKSYLVSKDIVTIIEEVKEDVKSSVKGHYRFKILNHVVCSIKDYLRN
jgi:hypothetical protein